MSLDTKVLESITAQYFLSKMTDNIFNGNAFYNFWTQPSIEQQIYAALAKRDVKEVARLLKTISDR